MIFKHYTVAWIIVCSLLSACSVLEFSGAATPTAMPVHSPSVIEITGTPTIVWFPATDTPAPAPFATLTATPQMDPGVGRTILHDAFTDPDLWDTAISDSGSSSVERNRITLAVQPKVYLFSLRHDLNLTDFYAEVTARLNLCRGTDDYGVLVRANAVAYYRFLLSCNGTVRAERVSTGGRSLLHDAIMSGDAPRGSPGEVRIGIWAAGTEMRLFLNGRYQFSINNPNYRNGTIGVFAKSAGDTPVTISFLDLVVQEVEFTPPTGIPAP